MDISSPLLEEFRAYLENVARNRSFCRRPRTTVHMQLTQSQNWCYIFIHTNDGCYCDNNKIRGCIALKDLSNETLGDVQCGELFEADYNNGPIKSAGGSIYDKTSWSQCTSVWGSIHKPKYNF